MQRVPYQLRHTIDSAPSTLTLYRCCNSAQSLLSFQIPCPSTISTLSLCLLLRCLTWPRYLHPVHPSGKTGTITPLLLPPYCLCRRLQSSRPTLLPSFQQHCFCCLLFSLLRPFFYIRTSCAWPSPPFALRLHAIQIELILRHHLTHPVPPRDTFMAAIRALLEWSFCAALSPAISRPSPLPHVP